MDQGLARGSIDTPIGRVVVVASASGVRRIVLPGLDAPSEITSVDVDQTHPVVAEACRQLQEYFDGSRRTFDLPLEIDGTPFQLSAWRALADVEFGVRASYAEQASRIGRPRAVRAVGSANRCNPVPIVLACHRIVGADGSLTGYAGGIDMKQWLLDHESGSCAADQGRA